jgi:hypothetical protein
MTSDQQFSSEDARGIGEAIGIDWSTAPFDVEQFRAGLHVELEHRKHDRKLITAIAVNTAAPAARGLLEDAARTRDGGCASTSPAIPAAPLMWPRASPRAA